MLVGKRKGKRQLGRPRHRSSGNAKGGHVLNLYGSGLEQVSGSCKCGIERSSFIKCGEFLD